MNSVLILNLGLKSIRSIILDFDGNKLASASVPVETFLKGDEVMQSPGEWWEKGKSVMRKTLFDKQIRDSVRYFTVTTSASCLIAVDSAGRELDKAIMVSDKRAVAESNEISLLPEFNPVQNDTGLRIDASLMLPKILWMKKHQPEIFNKTFKFLSPNDYLTYKITDKYVTDYFNAQKYHYSINKKAYPVKLLDWLGILPSSFPEVVAPGTSIGKISEEFASETGVSAAAEFIVTTYDAICSLFGSGVSEEGEAADVSGTVTSFRCLTHNMDLNNSPNLLSTPFVDWGIQFLGGSNNLGGGLIEWVKQCYYRNEPYPYEIMEKDANDSVLGARGIIFLPYLLGERAPIWDANASGVLFGLERSHTRKDITRAVFESAGFAIRGMVEEIEKSGLAINKIRVSGGLARIPLISQIKADVVGKEILVVDEFESTALGAAILALVGVGIYASFKEASDLFVSVRMIIRPNKKNHEKYNHVYNLYNRTYQTLKELFVDRKRMVRQIYRETEAHIENL